MVAIKMKHKILKSTLIVMTVTLFLKSLGFLREVILASFYGASVVTDAFVISSTLPSTVLSLIAGSISAVYIPQYHKAKGDKSIFTSNIINIFAVLGFLFSVIFTFVPQPLVYLFASKLDNQTFALASDLLRIMVWSAIPILLVMIYRSYLQIHDVFFKALIANSFVTISVILCIVLSSIFQNSALMAVGTVVGNFLCLFFLIAFSHKQGLRYHFYLNVKDSDLQSILHLLGPVMLASAVNEFNQIVDRNFASSLVSGSVSSLNYAGKVNGLFTAIIGSSLITVLFPRMSELAVNQNYKALEKYLSVGVKKLIPVLLPIMVGLIVLAKPLVRVLFERGAFTPEDTQRTAECLQMYAICFVVTNINPLFTKFFHSIQDTKTPATISAFSVGFNVIANFLLIGSMQHRGLALATSGAAIVRTILLVMRLRKVLGSLSFMSDAMEWLKIILSSVVMGIAVLIGCQILPVMTGSYFQCMVLTSALIFMAVVVYILMHICFRTVFLLDIIHQIQKQTFIKKLIKNRGRSK